MHTIHLPAGPLRYLDIGSGPPMLLLHGTLSNSHTWRKVLPLLSTRFRCIVPDLPLGAHTVPMPRDADLTPDGIADLLLALIRELGLQEVILVGNDTGGAYAQVFAVRNPLVISRLVLCSTDAFEVFPPRAFATVQAGVHLPGFLILMAQLLRIPALVRSPLALGLLSHHVTQEELSTLYVHSFIRSRRIRRDFAKVVRGWDPAVTLATAEQLRHFRQPSLILWGGDDQLFPISLGERLAETLPNATLMSIPYARTLVQEDQPEAFAAALMRFIWQE